MKLLTIAALTAILPAASMGIASAADPATGMIHSVQHVGEKARCSPGDPNVLVNKTAKTFVLDTMAAAPKVAKAAAHDDAAMGAGSTKSMSSMVSMCKSEALSMGAKMSAGGMKPSAKTSM